MYVYTFILNGKEMKKHFKELCLAIDEMFVDMDTREEIKPVKISDQFNVLVDYNDNLFRMSKDIQRNS